MKKTFLNSKFLNPFILVLLGVGLLHISWQKWTNIVWDYGRELYTPWRIIGGQVLYKDIASLFGPFPSYWNALLFKMFGVSIMTLALFNILLMAGIIVLMYRFFSYTTDRRVAFFVSAAFLSIFAFEQNQINAGIFGYICPYSYSVTYALFFSLWAIDRFAAYVQSGRDVCSGVVGFLIGLTALCRFEIFIFTAIALILGFISRGIISRWTLGQFLKAGALLLGGFLIPVGIAFLYFSTQLPLSRVATSIFGFNEHWREILKTDYYQFTTGLDRPWQNFIIMMRTAACYCFVFAVFKCLCMGAEHFRKGGRWQGIMFVLLGLAGLIQIASWILYFSYDEIFKGLPVMVMLMVGYLSWQLVKNYQNEGKVSRTLPLWVMAVWGLLMLIKVFLKVQLNSVGFVYAMPAFMLFIVLFQGFVPQYFERAYPKVNFVSILASVLTALFFITGLSHTAHTYQSRQFHIQSGPDRVISNAALGPEFREIDDFLRNADKIMGKNANFVAFPQGVMLNFLTKKINPVPYIVFESAELVAFGEKDMLRSFIEHRPDYVILTNEGIFPYSNPFLITNTSRAIRSWIWANYRPVWPKHLRAGYMIIILKRKEDRCQNS